MPLEAPQAHFKYYLENKETCLGLIDGKVLSSERVLDKEKKLKNAAAFMYYVRTTTV